MRSAAGLLLAVLLAGCASVAQPLGAPVGGVPGLAPGAASFAECQVDSYAYTGETTLAALGLGQMAGPEAGKVGRIWVTAEPVSMDGFGGGKGLPGDVPAQRWVCVEWPDGSGMASPIDDEWVPPSILDGGSGTANAGEGLPVGVLAVVIGVAALIGVSMLAFGRETA